MKPFYEQRKGNLQIGISHNITYPEHLHNLAEMLYVLEGSPGPAECSGDY